MERYFGPDDIVHLEHTEWQSALAMVFADYLNDYRHTRGSAIRSLGITVTRPECDSGILRLPHLVVFQENDNLQDVVLWERIAVQDARIWLGSDLPDQDFVETHLDNILTMKQRIRSNAELTEADKRVKEKMAGRYLSILFVYQNFQLFKELWDNKQWIG